MCILWGNTRKEAIQISISRKRNFVKEIVYNILNLSRVNETLRINQWSTTIVNHNGLLLLSMKVYRLDNNKKKFIYCTLACCAALIDVKREK